MWITTMVLITATVYPPRCIWYVLLLDASHQLIVKLREDYYCQLSRQYLESYLHHHMGDLMTHMTSDVNRVVFAAEEEVLTLMDSLVMDCVVLIMASTQISRQLVLFALLSVPVMVVTVKRSGDALHKHLKLTQTVFSSLNDRTQENLTSIHMTKASGPEDRQSALFAADTENIGKKNMQAVCIDVHFNPAIYITIGIVNSLTIDGGSWMVV